MAAASRCQGQKPNRVCGLPPVVFGSLPHITEPLLTVRNGSNSRSAQWFLMLYAHSKSKTLCFLLKILLNTKDILCFT